MATYELQISIPTGGVSIPCSALQSWEIENTDAANSVYVNEQVMPPSAATSGGKEVAAGLARILYFDPAQNPLIYIKAATATVLINIRKQTFRSRVIWNLARLASTVSRIEVDNFLQRVSATVVKLANAYTEFRADTVRNKTAGTALAITVQAIGTDSVNIGTPTAAPAGTVRLGVATSFLEADSGQVASYDGGTKRLQVGGGEVRSINNSGILMYVGAATDPRHTLSATEYIAHTPVAGGNINSSLRSVQFPIVNGAVVAVGDLVEFAPNSSNRVQTSAVGSTNQVIGKCIVGGTGNAGGTVMARMFAYGYLLQGFLADTGGVTAGQYIKPGLNNANQIISAATQLTDTFGQCLLTAIAGALTDVFLTGPSSG